MTEYAFRKAVTDLVLSLKDLPLPALLADEEFYVHWSNSLAKTFYSHFTVPVGLQQALEEFYLPDLLRDVRDRGSYTIKDIIPLSGICMNLSPVWRDGAFIGVLALFTSEDLQLDINDFYQTTKTAAALGNGIRQAVDSMFSTMDTAAAKADIVEAGWIKPSFERLGHLSYRILRIADNITEFCRYQSGMMDLCFQVVDIFSLLREWQATVEALAGSMGVPLRFLIPQGSAYVRLDRQQFALALFNLLHNALYFTRPGNEVELEAKRRSHTVSLWVRDKGLGIPPQVLPFVFRPYMAFDHQGKQSTVGLGLTLAKIAVQAHGGQIDIQSRPGQGTAVTVELPENTFSQPAPLAQQEDSGPPSDRFSRLYTGLMDSLLSPYSK